MYIHVITAGPGTCLPVSVWCARLPVCVWACALRRPLLLPLLCTVPLLQRVRLGARYDTLRVEVEATPYERHPSSARCTMPSPHAHRHLRHVTGAAAARAYQQLLAAAAAGDEDAAAAAAAAAAGWDLPPTLAEAQAEMSTLTAAEAYSGGPTGGRVEVVVDATGVTSGAVPGPGEAPAPGVRIPTLDVSIRGTNLHAPLIERLIELPMDISAGRVRAGHAAGWGALCPG